MPTVETSVAVATPLTTAARISTGRTSAGKPTTKVLPTVDSGARATGSPPVR